ncbi:MAG TPA: type II toxin-antitoxin system VapC family toxin [Rudaea sp.]|jgi:predicted nucleic-acid-binding protein|uniref:PIN domain-containing protein n=1 Tax=Rudaea sp. TaxID=2136325 RepID=UPI002F95943B
MIGIDTNILVRYIVQDEPAQARAATHFVERVLSKATPGFVNRVVLCELVWVLESGYGYTREQIAATLQRLFEIDRIRLESPDLNWRALDAYRHGIDFSDALIALINVSMDCEHTVSFDRRAARFEKIKLLAQK